MNLAIYQNDLKLIRKFVYKLRREKFPMATQKILIKSYADDLKIDLTNKMIFEILTSPIHIVN